jgi:hypothetical protein
MTNLLGKRYVCAECAVTLLVTKAGAGVLQCHDREMELSEAKPLPASD